MSNQIANKLIDAKIELIQMRGELLGVSLQLQKCNKVQRAKLMDHITKALERIALHEHKIKLMLGVVMKPPVFTVGANWFILLNWRAKGFVLIDRKTIEEVGGYDQTPHAWICEALRGRN